PDNYFDFVHQRFLVAGVPKSKWDDVLKELNRITKPGGLIEIVECDEFQSLGPVGEIILGGIFKALELRGLDINIAYSMKDRMQKIGLKVESENTRLLPNDCLKQIGWRGKIGELNKQSVVLSASSMKPYMMKSLELTSDEYDNNVTDMIKEFSEYQSFNNIYSFVGRKPSLSGNSNIPKVAGEVSVRRPLSTNLSKTEIFSNSPDTAGAESENPLKLNKVIAKSWKPQRSHSLRDDARLDNKRRYHAVENSPYPLPSDIGEQDRLEIQNTVITLLFGKLFNFPLAETLKKKGALILDVGCGSGSWSRDVATKYPLAEVHAV
ncbi:hypothetical protein HK096_010793, partial [Nowakowskiella sp. JEL0078]